MDQESLNPPSDVDCEHQLEHIPAPPPLIPAGLESGLYHGSAPIDVAIKNSRKTILGPKVIKKGDKFVCNFRSVHVEDKKPSPCQYNLEDLRNVKFYKELQKRKRMDDYSSEEEPDYGSDDDAPRKKKREIQHKHKCVAYVHAIGPEGHTVLAHVHGFRPYFYVKADKSWTKQHMKNFCTSLEWRCKVPDHSIRISMKKKKEFVMFTPDPDDPMEPYQWLYMKVSFPNMESWRHAYNIMNKYPLNIRSVPQTKKLLKTEETRIDNDQRFIDELSLVPEGWMVADEWSPIPKQERVSTCAYEIKVNMDDIHLLEKGESTLVPDPEQLAIQIGASTDIECFASGGFPDPENDDDVCFMVNTSFCFLGEAPKGYNVEEPFLRVQQVMPSCEAVDGVIIEQCDTEYKLLNQWSWWNCHVMDADLIITYNGDRFDIPFLCKKGQNYGRKTRSFFHMSRIVGLETEPKSKFLSSGALGDNELVLLKPQGRNTFDLFQFVKANFKLSMYSLDFVGETFLKERKHPVVHTDIFAGYQGSDRDRMKIAAYCAQDCDLPIRIMRFKKIYTQVVQQSRVMFTPQHILTTSGQQVRVLNQIMYYAHREGFIINMLYDTRFAKTKKYGGGTVIEPEPGFHTEPVAVLDFASLYPSIMMAHNFCYSTMIPPETELPKSYFDKGLKVLTVDCESGNVHRFVQNNKGILPMILRHLKKERNAAKAEMKKTNDPNVAAVYNGRQLAIKVSMNSAYGFCGTSAGTGKLPCEPVAESVTTIGGRMIMHSKDCCEKWGKEEGIPVRVIYGDSVTGDTPILIRKNGVVQTCRIDELVSEWKPQGEKQVGVLDAEVWSDNGFTKIYQVTRHHTDKEIVRVVTHTGVVDATTDHSLLDTEGKEVSPKNVTIGDRLLHNIPDQFGSDDTIDEEEAFAMGLFAADGSCGSYDCPSGKKSSWAINNQDKILLERTSECLPFKTKVLETMESSHVYKLVACSDGERGGIVKIVTRYRKLFYNEHREKRVPPEILNSPKHVLQKFWDGFYSGDGSRKEREKQTITRCSQKGKEMAQGLCIVMQRLGLNVSLNTRKDKQNIMRLSGTKGKFRKDERKVKKVYPVEHEGFVYDLTTDNHHFHVGPGNLVVHNTDSVMVIFGGLSKRETFDKGEVYADRLTNEFDDPNEMEMEKIYNPYLLKGKKMYSGLCFTSKQAVINYETYEQRPTQQIDELKQKLKEEKDPDAAKALDKQIKTLAPWPYVDTKGLTMVRRDNCAIVRDSSKKILNSLFERGDHEENLGKAVSIAQETVQKVVDNKVALEDYVITKSMKKDYSKSMAVQPQVAVAWRHNFQSGDRVPYIISDKAEMDRCIDPEEKKNEGPKKRLREDLTEEDYAAAKRAKSDKIPLAAYARHPSEMSLEEEEGKYQPDRYYVLEKQLRNPFSNLFVERWDDVEAALKDGMNTIKKEKEGLQGLGDFIQGRGSKPKVRKVVKKSVKKSAAQTQPGLADFL